MTNQTTTNPITFALDADGWTDCPACGDPIDYCQGHGDIGDPLGADILRRHDDGDHSHCLTMCSPSEH